MTHRLSKFFLMAGLLLAISLAITPVGATARQGESGGFSETFDDPKLPGWERSPEVIVSNGALRIAPGNFAARPGAWQNFQLSFRLRLDGRGETQVNFRDTEQARYSLIFTEQSLVLMRFAQGAESALGEAPLEYEAQSWLQVQINASLGDLQVLLGGVSALRAFDSQPLAAGGLVFFSHGQRTSEVDDLTMVVHAGAPAPPEEAPSNTPGPAVVQPPTPTPDTAQDWAGFLRSFASSPGNPLELSTFAVNLLFAVLFSFILSRVYIYWGSSLSNRRKFAGNFILITVTTTFIILVVRSSVALSLGLVGALSIIRFRAAIKEPEELAYLFFAISLGIGLGDNQRLVTLISLLVVIGVIGLARLLRQENSDPNLHLSLSSRSPNKLALPEVQSVLEQHCSRLRLLRFDESPEMMEVNFVVEFRHISDLENLRASLQTLYPTAQISFLDNKGVW